MASFGENLRRERELRGIELREMADATKISIRFLNAIEQDRVDVLPGGIFPKAFVRQYARYLGLDPDRVVAEFVYAHGGEPVPPKGKRAQVRVDEGGVPRGIVLVAVALALLGLVGWKVRGQASRVPPPATASVPAPPTPTFAHDRVYPPPSGATASPASVAPGALAVTLVARRSSWVEAKADGTTVLSRVLKDGESQRVEARQEIVLSLGNAGGIAVTLNDRPLAPLGRDGEKRNVAINAQTVPALLAAAAPSPAASPRPAATRPSTPRPPSPSPSPSVLFIPSRPGSGAGTPLLPPPSRPSPSPSTFP